jgi:hypothetical protein
MNTDQIVTALIAERDRLTAAINLLQGGTPAKRLGRPPKSASMPDWVTNGAVAPVATPAKKQRKRVFTAEQREAQAKRMKAFWKKKKAARKG